MDSRCKLIIGATLVFQMSAHAQSKSYGSSSSSRSYSGSSSYGSSSSSRSYGSSSGSTYKSPSTSYGGYGSGSSSSKPSTSYGSSYGSGYTAPKPSTPSPAPSYKPSTPSYNYGGSTGYSAPKPTPAPAPAPKPSTPSYNYGGSTGYSGSTPSKPATPAPTPAPAPKPYQPSFNYGGTTGKSTGGSDTPAPKKSDSYGSTGGSVGGRLGGSPQPTPAPQPSLKTAPLPKSSTQSAPIANGYNPYAPFNGGATESKATVKETVNKDNSITRRYTDDQGNLRQTQVIKNGQVVQDFKKGTDGTVINSYGSGSVKITPNATGGKVKEFSDGRKVSTSKVVDPRTGYETIRKESVRPDGARIVRQNQYRPIENWNQNRRGDSGPSVVYVPRNESMLENPWFWMWMMQNNQRQSGGGYSGGGYSGGGYSGGGAGGALSGSNDSPAQMSPPAPKPFSETWNRTFSNLPEKYKGKREYTDPAEWMTDYVMMSVIAENVPARSWWATHLCLWWCADTENDYDLPIDIRNDLKTQILTVLDNMKNKKDVALYKFMTEKGLDDSAKNYLLIANDELEVRAQENEATCTLGSGAVIALEEYSNESGMVTARIISQPNGGDLCEAKTKIRMKATDAQNFQNEFLEKLDDAVQAGMKFQKKQGASLAVPQLIETI